MRGKWKEEAVALLRASVEWESGVVLRVFGMSGETIRACCLRSSSSFKRKMLARSQLETLYGWKNVPDERSHQHLSAARITVGMGPV